MAGQRLAKLRTLMSSRNVQAVIVPTDDAHASEYVSSCDKRRQFISDFTGSAGTAVITTDQAALWTDGRYFTQASQELDPNHWILMKQGNLETPSESKWLAKVLQPKSTVWVDGTLYAGSAYKNLSSTLTKYGLELSTDGSNLIDEVWQNRPPRPANPLYALDESITGRSWQNKLKMVRDKMAEVGTEYCILSALDDISWTLNLRGSDISCNPCFFSYLLISMDTCHLYLQNTSDPALDEVRKGGVQIENYKSAITDIVTKIGGSKVWITAALNHAIASKVGIYQKKK